MLNLAKKILPEFLFNAGKKIATYIAVKYYSLKFKKLIIRKGTSDEGIFVQMFIKRFYALPIKIEPKVIIDGGANVGYAALWFNDHYPKAKIIAIEPEESNFKVLKKNTERIKNITAIKAGIWDKDTFLRIVDKNSKKSGFVTKEVSDPSKSDIKAMTIDSIMRKFNIKKIDILKLDVEGAEKEIFSGNTDWLDKVSVLFIELHDRRKQGCSESVYSVLKRYEWKEVRNGNDILLIKESVCQDR